MRLLHWWLVAGAVSVGLVIGPAPARAEDRTSRGVVVVDVARDAKELDAGELREAIGAELGAEAISPGDPRERAANGTIRVFIDHDARELVVVYRGRAGEIERRIPLGSDHAALEREAVLLAGNLARDEAGDLLAQLRKKAVQSTPPAKVTTVAATTGVPARDSAERASPDDEDWDADERLRSTLARYAEKDRDTRLVGGWVLFGIGAAAIGGGAYWVSQDPQNLIGPLSVIGAGAITSALGTVLLFDRTVFEDLHRYYDDDLATGRSEALVRSDVERLWREYANSERTKRRRAGWALIGTAAAFVALGVAQSLNWGAAPARFNFSEGGSWFALSGILLSIDAPFLLNAPGPIESRLQAYQSSALHTVTFGGQF